MFPLVFKALNKAFSAPKIYTVEAGYFTKLVRPPAWEISLAPTFSPIKAVRLGATLSILSLRYPAISFLKANYLDTLEANYLIFTSSNSVISDPMELLEASITI